MSSHTAFGNCMYFSISASCCCWSVLGKIMRMKTFLLNSQANASADQNTTIKTIIEFSPCRDHVSNRLVESLHLLRLKIADDRVDASQQLVDERHHLSNLKSIVVIMIPKCEQLWYLWFLSPELGRIAFYTWERSWWRYRRPCPEDEQDKTSS